MNAKTIALLLALSLFTLSRASAAEDEPVVPAEPAAPAPLVPVTAPAAAVQQPPSMAAVEEKADEPFAFGDFTWQNGTSRQRDFPLKALGDAVTLSLYLDFNYAYSSNHPRDNTLTSSASVSRVNEIGINLVSVGFDWNYKHVIGRISLQYGNQLSIIQDLDGTAERGRSLSIANLRYIREAVAGYHFDVAHGLNVEGGIFMSYIGLESYLLAENWNYTRSLICEHTPFYFQGIRAQYFPSAKVKIEPWLMNGWQSYGKWNYAPSGGVALRWSPHEWLSMVGNFYLGTDTRGEADRVRFHHDDSVVLRYFQEPKAGFVSKAAFSLNNHVGFEAGGESLPGPAHAHVLGSSLVHRTWFAQDHLAFALRGEVFSNPSRYLTQYPPPGFETGPGVKALQFWGLTGTVDVMPNDFFTLRFEGSYRAANAPYFAGPGGTTSPSGFQPIPASFTPDAVKSQALGVVAVNIRL